MTAMGFAAPLAPGVRRLTCEMRARRIAGGMTIRDMARAIGATPVRVGEIERGVGEPASLSEWCAVAAALREWELGT